MMRTPASTRSSATFCAAPAGTASTPTTMFLSRTVSFSRRSSSTALPPMSMPILRRLGVEDRGDVDAVLREDRRARDRLAEAAGADERDVVLPLRAQDLADLAEQRVDRVADTALAELAEVREIAADLRRVDVRVVGDLLRGDALLAHLLGLAQHLQIARETGRDTDGQTVRVSPVRNGSLQHHEHCARRLGYGGRLSQTLTLVTALLSLLRRLLVEVVDERPLAVDLDHRQPLAVARLETRVAGDVDSAS